MKINFLTIGTSWITEEFIHTAKMIPEFHLYAVYSRNKTKAAAFAKKHGAEKFYDSLEEAAADPEINSVYIASPNALHCGQALRFLNAKKNVLCEKPMASNLREAKKMVNAAKASGVLLEEAYKPAALPAFAEMKKNLKELGTIRSVYFEFSKYSSRYDAHKRGEPVNTFKNQFSNGALLDLGIYSLMPLLHLFGKPKQIRALANIIPGGVDGTGGMILQYEDFIATAMFSKISTSYLPCQIQGEKATMLIDKINIPEKIEIIYANGEEKIIKPPQRKESMFDEIADFITCAAEGKTESEINPLFLSLASAEITDEARRQFGLSYPADYE